MGYGKNIKVKECNPRARENQSITYGSQEAPAREILSSCTNKGGAKTGKPRPNRNHTCDELG